MLARPLLRTGHLVNPFAVRSIASPGGVANHVNSPRAFTSGTKTYFGYVDDSHNIYAASYDAASHTASTPFLVGSGFASVSGDIHNSIGVLVRQSDQRLLIVELSEDDPNPFSRISTNPNDATAWAAAAQMWNADSQTWIGLCQLSGESGKVYAFMTRLVSGVRYLAYSTSTDEGATWSGRTNLIKPVSTDRTYRRIVHNGVDRIDIFTTTTDRTSAHPSPIYHFYITGGNLYQTDGALVGAITSGPYFADAGTLVQDASLGSAEPGGEAYDGSGNPACLIGINDGNTNTNVLWRQAYWTGSAWAVSAVASTGGVIDSNTHVSGGAMAWGNPNRLFLSIKDGTHFEMFEYRSGDGGATWPSVTQLTSGSSSDAAQPFAPMNATNGLLVAWSRGTYTSDSNLTFDIEGWGS